MSKAYTAQVAKARIIYYKDRETYKIIFAFNVYKELNNNNEEVYKFPKQAKCNYVSGDIVYSELEKDKQRIIETAKKHLRTDYIEFV